MRRVEQLIMQVRRATENTRIGTQDGISDEEFIQYLNDGQELCSSAIIQVHRTAFSKEKVFAAPGTESYTLPFDIWAKQRVLSVEYSPDGQVEHYYTLDQARIIERYSRIGNPSQYILFNNKLLLNAYPRTGSFRITYDPMLPRLDKRRTTVGAITFSATAVTALTLSTSAPFTASDYSLFDQLSIVGADGTVKMSGLPFTAVNAGTGVVSILNTTFTFATGETGAIGDYICLGVNATTTSSLPDQCEKFLLAYAQRRIMDRDSSTDRVTMTEDEQNMLADIVGAFADSAGDMDDIVVKNYDYFDDIY